ncbi:hypothetical protein JCM8097_004317 [Rhodosporidiobolus ruineniae]
MGRITENHSLVPPTLLPFLHDLHHHEPARWFAELEQVYRTVDNMPNLFSMANNNQLNLEYEKAAYARAQEEVRVAEARWHCGLGWFSSMRTKKRLREHERSSNYSQMRNEGHLQNWYLLLLVRDKYLSHKLRRAHSLKAHLNVTLSLPKREQAAALGNLPPLPVPLTVTERAHFATFGVVFPPSSAKLIPAYPEVRPLDIRTCPLLKQVDAYAARQRKKENEESWDGPLSEELRVRWAKEGEDDAGEGRFRFFASSILLAMVPIDLHTRLIPRSLGPFLHDCLHRRPVQYFRELEEVYCQLKDVQNRIQDARHLHKQYDETADLSTPHAREPAEEVAAGTSLLVWTC